MFQVINKSWSEEEPGVLVLHKFNNLAAWTTNVILHI